MTEQHVHPLRAPLVHVLVLAALTTATNAAAIAPNMFGGGDTVLALAIATIMTASLESIIGRPTRARIAMGTATRSDRDLLRLQTWGCALAALVSIVCVLATIIR